MNHKRRRPKNRRAGCLMCKSHKMNGAKGCLEFRHGFGKIKAVYFARFDQREG